MVKVQQTILLRSICDMIYSMEAKVGISKVEIQVKIGCGGEFWQKRVIYVVIKFETSTL